MRKFLLSAALATATLAAVPAAAQHRDHDRGDRYDRRDHDRGDRYDRNDRHDRGDRRGSGWNQRGPDRHAVMQLRRELNQVEMRIQRLAQRRAISPREALSLRREANRIENRLQRAGRNGLTGREFAELRVQVNRLEQRVRIERRDRDGRRW